jgi:signal transduction histidine kinase
MNFSLSVRRTFQYLECFFAAVLFLIGFSQSSFNLEKMAPSLVFYGIFILLSWIFPVERPYWQRVGYLILGIALAVFSTFVGVNSDLFVFLYLAKSSFLLKREQVYITAIIAGILWISSQLISDYVRVKGALNLDLSLPEGFESYNPTTLIIFYFSIYLVSSTFALLFSFMMIAEHKSRARAETLAEQVETLAAALERTRIARDIHDSLGHTLTNLDMQLQVAMKLRQRDPYKAFQSLEHAKQLSSQCIDDVSRVLQTMRQSDFDLNQALETLVEQVRQTHILQIQENINLPKLPLQTSHHIYCIVKEGLINIQKHANATHVCVRGQSTPNSILLDLKDDGVGFNLELQPSGFGLQGIAERVNLLGGELKIHSTPGSGTQLQVAFPYDSTPTGG